MSSVLSSSLRLSPYLPLDPRDPTGQTPYTPTAPQAAFLLLDGREALYGGAAGGGKSDALLAAYLQYAHVPGYAGLILRRTFRDLALPDAIMDRAKKWLLPHPEIRWADKDKTFTFPSGATLTFGYLEQANDHLSYQGSAYQYVAFDELTQFEEYQYVYLFSRARKPPEMPVPVRIRAGSNPGGPGHEWVKARFDLGSQPPRPIRGRRFIPARVEDNPHIDQEQYLAGLDELGPVEKARLKHGDWGARPPGEMFDRSWFTTILPHRPDDVDRWVRRWDFASTAKRKGNKDPDYTVGTLMGRRKTGAVVIADVVRFQKDPGDTEAAFLATAAQDGRSVAVRWEREGGSAGKMLEAGLVAKLMGYDAAGVPSTGEKSIRARPLAAFAKVGLVHLVEGLWIPDWLAELEAFPQDSVHDDQADSASGAFEDLGGIGKPAGASTAPPTRHDNPYHSDRGGRRPRSLRAAR